MMQRRRLIQACAAASISSVAPSSVFAQVAAFPSRPIRILLPFAAGGSPDVITRLIAQQLTIQLGQGVVVENRPGANGIIATDAVAKAPPDGYTLLATTGAHAVNPAVYKKLPFDTVRDFAPVSLARSTLGYVLVVNPQQPATLRDFVATARQPGITFGSPGVGNSLHLAGETLNLTAGTKMLHVPYKGAAPALQAVIGGEIQAIFLTVTAALPALRAGQVRALGVTSATRLPALPDVPPIGETVPGYIFSGGYNAFFAPAKTPPEIVRQLSVAINRAVHAPEVEQKILAEDGTPIGSTPEELARVLREDMETVARIVKATGIKVE